MLILKNLGDVMVLMLAKKALHKAIKIEHWKLMLMGFIFFILSSCILYLLEPNTFKNPFTSFWYVMSTVAQIGYGDYTPHTVIGRLYAIFMYVVGIGFFVFIVVTKWVDFLNEYQELKEIGNLRYSGKKHLVMMNWSQKTKMTIEEIIDRKQNIDIVLIDQFSVSPLIHNKIHYIQGNATEMEVLEQANVLQAESICIFAPENAVDAMSADGKNLLIASTIKHFAEQKNIDDIHIIVEILDEDHIVNNIQTQEHIGEFILSNKSFSQLMATTALQYPAK
jgi:voltage-gated potassium channel